MRAPYFLPGCLAWVAARAAFAALALSAAPSAWADPPLFFVDSPFDPPQVTTIYTIDPGTGAMIVRGDLGNVYTPILALAAADGTTLYAAGSDNAGTVCPGATMACLLLKIVLHPSSTTPVSMEIVGPIHRGTTPVAGVTGMTFRNDGALYVESQDDSGLYVLDPATAEATFVGNSTAQLYGGDLTFDADDRLILWTNDLSSPAGLYRIDPGTAAATLIDSDPGSNYAGLAALGHSNELYAANVFMDRLYRVDPVGGFMGPSVPMTIDGAPFDHKRGDLDSPYCADDAACDDGSACTTDVCTPGGCRHLSIDVTCDGVDDDCDGLTDEDYVPVPTACGVGACTASGTTSCAFGAIVDDCAPAPAQMEICNLADDDCDGSIDNGVAAPSGVGMLLVDKQPSGAARLSWTAVNAAQSYQVTRGNLGTLIATGGDFASASEGCLADVAATDATDTAPPESSGGVWYLVRARNCGGTASYDEPAGSQSGSRDAGIAASPNACP